MKWGVRKYQRADGSLTSSGKKRYNTFESAEKKAKRFSKYAKQDAAKYAKSGDKRLSKIAEGQVKRYDAMAKDFAKSKVSDLGSSQAYKAGKKFAKKAFFTNAEFGDIYFKGKVINSEDYDNRSYIINNHQNEEIKKRIMKRGIQN